MQISSLYDTSFSFYNNKHKQNTNEILKPLIKSKNEKAQSQKDTQNNEQTKNAIQELSPQEEALVLKLQARDTEVRAHEAAHIAAGGSVVTGGASFTYQKGPDGKNYAIGGEVPIDTSTESSYEKTIVKMQKVRTAALAPANPSPQDFQVASTATILEMQARVNLMREKSEELDEKTHEAYKNTKNETQKDLLDVNI